jgi:hypothetical protein
MLHDRRNTSGARLGDLGLPPRRAGAGAAPRRKNRHAPDAGVWQQPPRTDRFAARRLGQHVPADRIESIPLERYGHRLLAHEDLFANRAQARRGLLPRYLAHMDLGWHRRSL